MDIQQILAFGIVGFSALYLLRNLYRSVRSVLRKEAGCGSGCGKCSASQNGSTLKPNAQRISISEVRPISRNPK